MHLSINPYVVVVVDVFVVFVVCIANLSLAAEVTCISVFPRFWIISPMIHVQELPMTVTVAYIDSPSM